MFTIICSSCGKEETVSNNECSEIINYAYESDIDFAELFGGEKFTFRKVGSTDVKYPSEQQPLENIVFKK